MNRVLFSTGTLSLLVPAVPELVPVLTIMQLAPPSIELVVPLLCLTTVLPVELCEQFLRELAIIMAPLVSARGSESALVLLMFMLVVR